MSDELRKDTISDACIKKNGEDNKGNIMGYILGIDQSTQGTKMLLFDANGAIVTRADKPHRQIVNELGYVSHDMEEVYQNVLALFKETIEISGIAPSEIHAIGISNQRETTVAWEKDGTPYAPAIVWQCSRASEIVARMSADEKTKKEISDITGIPLSPFFPAAKMRWLLENECKDVPPESLHLGTVDSYLVYRLTGGEVFATDASNASRTQLMNLDTLSWSTEMCSLFGVPMKCLPEIKDSNAYFGETNFGGLSDVKIPIRCVMGDSHGALYGQHCIQAGMMKTTYGTGSSVMLNTGAKRVFSKHGLATSLAWSMDGKADYVLEGNINYTGAVISWLKDDLELISSASETNQLCEIANPADTAVVVPAFTGLSAPYWENDVKAAIVGMTRTTRKAEMVRAAVESIAQQITDVYEAMELDFGQKIEVLRADGGPTKNPYLMQFQSDMTGAEVYVSSAAELSAIGVAYLAGITSGLYDETEVFQNLVYTKYHTKMDDDTKNTKRDLWRLAISMVLS